MPIRFDHLSTNEREVLSILLRNARGAENAIPVPAVADAAGIHERFARKVVKALVEVHRIPIASSCSPERPGWYLCVTAAEADRNRKALRRRAVSILQRAHAFEARHSELVAQLEGQTFLDLEELAEELEGADG